MSLHRPLRLLLFIALPALAVLVALIYSLTWRPLPHENAPVACNGQVAQLQPGQALYIPVGWWHQVASLDFSVSITYTNFHWPNDFHIGHPA